MIKVDLITGFLGSGKTTFLKKYAKRCMARGEHIGILENDHGAVNVDMLMLHDLRGDNCELEMVAGGCDADCHRRRFKTKLIAMGMTGYDRVIIEPSGIFDVDEFFDALREEPLDKWYEIGTVIGIVDGELPEQMSPQADYLLASQVACVGTIVVSKLKEGGETDGQNAARIAAITAHLQQAAARIGCSRDFAQIMVAKPWERLTDADMDGIAGAGCRISDFIKLRFPQEFSAVYFLASGLHTDELLARAQALFAADPGVYGKVYRIKGYCRSASIEQAAKAGGEPGWVELNATPERWTLNPVPVAQEVFIVIGEGLNEDRIRQLVGCPIYGAGE